MGSLADRGQDLTGSALSFTFTGLVIASTFYSLPFVVQPLHGAFRSPCREEKPLEAAWALGASKLDTFFTAGVPNGHSWIPDSNCPRIRATPLENLVSSSW